ncbi:MAG: aldo/keto reductase [Planctomicrobium sp.]|jgi:D-xylose reductase|nr:aldo/keto reductase [Planctomicrobium sp.]
MYESIELTSGDQLPSVGLGVWKIDPANVGAVVSTAIEFGYRHLDCACDYGNEEGVGDGIRDALDSNFCKREDLWVTSKLWNTYHNPEHVRPALQKSLDDLGLEYLDLYLIHFPISLMYVPIEERYPPGWIFNPDAEKPKMEFSGVPIQQTWQALEELVDEGLIKNIGICNFTTGLMSDLLSYARIRPSVLQVELHPYLAQEKLLRYCQQEEIAVTGFSPLGALSYVPIGMAEKNESVLEEEIVTEIAERHDKTAAQVVLRWGVQRGTSIVAKTSNKDRLKENLDLFDFELTDEEMQAITSLDQHKRFNDPGDFGPAAFNTFCPIYD